MKRHFIGWWALLPNCDWSEWKTNQAHATYIRQQVHFKVTTVGGRDLNYAPLLLNQPITSSEWRNSWLFFAPSWYFAGSWLLYWMNPFKNDMMLKKNNFSLQWCKHNLMRQVWPNIWACLTKKENSFFNHFLILSLRIKSVVKSHETYISIKIEVSSLKSYITISK